MLKQMFVCKICLLIISSVLLYSGTTDADPGRFERELSGEGWTLWPDREADWENDSIFMPPVDITKIPVNAPSCGWDKFERAHEKLKVNVPGTVEEYCWGANGNPIGIAGDYRGVSWWSRSFTLDPALKSKRIMLLFDSVNLRAEVFVNRKLVGYDVIGNTPFVVDVTNAVLFSGENQLDVRITDPGGNFNS